MTTTPAWALEKIERARKKRATKLDLSALSMPESERLRSVPDEVFALEQLQVLNLFYNRLTTLPDSIGRLARLIILDLDNNQLTSLPDSITRLATLRQLDLSANQFTTLPDSIGGLTSLTTLDLSHNQLTTLPDSIGDLTSLTTLNLYSNQLTSLPDSITRLTSLTYLSLIGNQLTTLPDNITHLTGLTTLDLSYNQLTSLPDSITHLTSLTTLHMASNRLTTLPDSITHLAQLAWLYLYSNQLTTLPDSVDHLTGLKELDLSDNRLTTLPDGIGRLTSLRSLSLRANQLTSLPDSIGRLTSLRRLSLSYNRLIALPDSITRLTSLTELDLRSNKLTAIPAELAQMPAFRELELDGNPLETPPSEVAKRGIKAISQYFAQRAAEGTDYIYEAKLLIVGEAGAGKTTLARKIVDAQAAMPAQGESTRGIAVGRWSFAMPNGRPFRLSIWDFGGQEIYHQTHQFFLTKRSLYALVTDNRELKTDFFYWLNAIELLGGESPVLIVKNEKEERRQDINEAPLRARFGNLKEILSANLKSNAGLPALLDCICYHAQHLPHVGAALPKTWVAVRARLESDPRNYIGLDEYLQICTDNGFKKREDALQLSGYLHDLGVILHFQEDDLLSRYVILKPGWGTEAVYKLLDDPGVAQREGRFSRSDVKAIWSEEQHAGMQPELLRLQINFRLCYEIPGKPGSYIAPQLLSVHQPEYPWDDSDNLILRYTYEFMPKGIVQQLTVAMHQHIAGHTCVWRSGVLLERDGTRAEVIEHPERKEITLRLAGTHKRDLLSVVTYELDRIHASFNRLKYDKLVPCNCRHCKGSQTPFFYTWETLQRYRDRRRQTIECQNSFEDVSVSGLIDDVGGAALPGGEHEEMEQELPDDMEKSRAGGQPVNPDNKKREQLHAALLSGYRDTDELAELVDFGLNEKLNQIAAAPSTQRKVAYDLITWAQARGRLDELVAVAFERRPLNADLRQAAAAFGLAPLLTASPDPKLTLEAIVNQYGRFADPEAWMSRMSQVVRSVCRIEIPTPGGQILGTGFLIGPSTVMTNYHVIAEGLAHQADPRRIVLRFDYTVSAEGKEVRPGVSYRLAEGWLIDQSPLEDLDYAILRLAGRPGDEPIGDQNGGPKRGWLTPLAEPLHAGQPLFVVQHPAGEPMKVAFDVVVNVTPTRVAYRTNTEGGSSGSPAFGDHWDLLALHHAGGSDHNEGIPFSAILERPAVKAALGV